MYADHGISGNSEPVVPIKADFTASGREFKKGLRQASGAVNATIRASIPVTAARRRGVRRTNTSNCKAIRVKPIV